MSRSRARSPLIARFGLGGVAALLLTTLLGSIFPAMAAEPGNQSFTRTWERPDKPVAEGMQGRTWMWGPEATTEPMTEAYAESPGGQRTVQYFDKARMEISNPSGDQGSPWYVTNGLLVIELMTGKMQVGDNQFETRQPAEVNVAGDADDPSGPTYRSLQAAMDIPARGEGAYVMERIDRSGVVTEDPALIERGVIAAHYVAETDHTVAGPFWDFMNSSGLVYLDGQFQNDELFPNPYYATGLPITEAYWAQIKVGGVYKDVLMQCFERRCLTYTPGNPEGWQVEAGNVGLHYLSWRYGQTPGEPPSPDPSPTPEPSPTPDPTPDPNPEPMPEPEPAIVDYDYMGAWKTQYGDLPGFNLPMGIAISADGRFYIADSGSHSVRIFSARGQFLGSWGSMGSGDDQFNQPEGVAIDADGNVYVADYNNSRVQKFGADGDFIATVQQDKSVRLQNATTMGPKDLAINADAGLLYIADNKNHAVRRIDLTSGETITFGSYGTENGKFNDPNGIGLDAAGNVFVADTGNHRIQKFTPDGQWITTFGEHGLAGNRFILPRDVAVAADGRVYITNSGDQPGNSGIKVWGPFNEEAKEYLFAMTWNSSGANAGMFDSPTRIVVDSEGYIYETERQTGRIQKFAPDGKRADLWNDAARGTFGLPVEVAYDDGYVYIADRERDQVTVFTSSGAFVRELTENVDEPVDVAVRDGLVYIVDQYHNEILRFSVEGKFLNKWGTLGSGDGQFNKPEGVAIDKRGYVHVLDAGNYRVQTFTAGGTFVKAWGSQGAGPGQFQNPKDIASHADLVYVVDFASRLQVFDLEGEYLRDVSEQGYEPGQLDGPYGVTVDAKGYVFVADRDNHRLQKFSADGKFVAMLSPDTTVTASQIMPEFSAPTGVAVAPNGMVFAVSQLLEGIMLFEPDTVS